MSYAAQLFESLLRASAETPGKRVAEADSLVVVGGQPPPSPAGMEPQQAAADALPHELDECYAVIRFQRAQILQLRNQMTTLEEQNLQVRRRR